MVFNLQFRPTTWSVRGNSSHGASLCLSVEISAVNIFAWLAIQACELEIC